MSLSRSRPRSVDEVEQERWYSPENLLYWADRLWRSGWLLPLLLTLPALAPLIRGGFFVSDDGLFHVYRIAALADAWEHGILYPRLFPQFGFGYGQAVLNYYAPLSYLPGALLAVIGMSPAAAAEWTIALGFLLAALAAYGMGKYLWGTAGGVLAAVIYTYFPYHLADAYLRGALPEHMALVFLPLIFWSTIAAFREEHPAPSYLWGALAWAGLVYTHNLTALLMAPAWLALVLLLGFGTGRWRRFWGAAAGVLLAVGLSAALWLPFLAESAYVGIGLGPSDGYQGHLAPLDQLIQTLPLYQYRTSHGAGLAEHPVGWPAALLAATVVIWLLWNRVRRRWVLAWVVAVFGLILAGTASLMTAAPSLPVWRLFQPVLAQLQYPWRFMTLAGLGLALASAVLGDAVPHEQEPVRERWVRGAVAGAVAVLFVISSLVRVPAPSLAVTPAEAWGAARMWQEDAAAGQVGATWTGEFLPQSVEEQRWALGRPLEGARDESPLNPVPGVRLEAVGYDRVELRFDANPAPVVRLHQFHLPMWQASVDSQPAATYPSTELGLVTVDVPPQAERVTFKFGPSRAWMASAAIVALAALAWAGVGWSNRWMSRRRDRLGLTVATPLLLLLVAGLIANGAGVGARTWTPAPVQTTVGDVAVLIGYDAKPAKGEQALDVTLYWFALRETAQDYKAFVHLLGADGQVVAQHDGDPVGGYTPTTRWKQGQLIADTHRLMLANDLAPGEYQLAAGLYEVRPGETPEFRNLPLDPPSPDSRVPLGRVSLPLSR